MTYLREVLRLEYRKRFVLLYNSLCHRPSVSFEIQKVGKKNSRFLGEHSDWHEASFRFGASLLKGVGDLTGGLKNL